MKGNKNILSAFPARNSLLEWYANYPLNKMLNINGHIHTPYSFSAFKSIGEAIDLAKSENINALGINDFFVTDGYTEFYETCLHKKIFPLFNIEFIGLNKDDQANDQKVNDPNNPGRTYLSGKALDFPARLSSSNAAKLDQVIATSQQQIKDMIGKLNPLLKTNGINSELTFENVRSRFAKNLVRERHLASAIRVVAEAEFPSESGKMLFYERLFNSPVKADVNNIAVLENEIRSKLLKAGGSAFVPEEEQSFLAVEELCAVILDAGGIPTYPLLLDDAKGNFTDFEGDREQLDAKLNKYGIYSIEFIPGRNSIIHLEDYSTWFFNKGYIVTYGTEHNTPSMDPITVTCRDGIELTDKLKQIALDSTAVLAAHQYLRSKGEAGYYKTRKLNGVAARQNYIKLGKAVIQYYLIMQ
jgi:hypothetical protein